MSQAQLHQSIYANFSPVIVATNRRIKDKADIITGNNTWILKPYDHAGNMPWHNPHEAETPSKRNLNINHNPRFFPYEIIWL